MKLKRRLIARCLAVLGVVAVTGALATTALGQVAPLRVVQGSDGTLYLVQGTNAWTLVPSQISDSDLAALNQSGQINGTIPVVGGSVAQAAPTVAAAVPPPPPPTSPPPPPTPVPPPPAPVIPAPTPKPSFPNDPLVVVQAPYSGENVGVSVGTFNIKGYALDRNAGPSQGTGVDYVSLYLNAPQSSGGIGLGNANLGQSNPTGGNYGSQFANSGWYLSFTPTKYQDGGTNVYAYAHSSVTGKTTMFSMTFSIVEGSGD